jgi:arylsulfatase A-like enzyme
MGITVNKSFMKKVLGIVGGWASFVLATAFAWGLAEAALNHWYPPKFVWHPDLFIGGAYGRVLFYACVVGAVALAAAACQGITRLLRRRPFDPGRRRWGWAAACGAIVAFNGGWFAFGRLKELTLMMPWGVLELTKLAGFIPFWFPFLAAGAIVTVILGLTFGKAPWRRRAGRIVRVLGTAGFLAVVAGYGGWRELRPVPRGPNIVLIVLDAWRADAFRPDLMPSLNAYAERNALVFERTWTNGTWTYPAMSVVFTGQYPDTIQGRTRPKADYYSPTLAQILRNAGYDTSALVANRLLDRHDPITDGFEDFFFTEWKPWLAAIGFYHTNWYNAATRKRLLAAEPDSTDSVLLTARLNAYISRPHRRPYFLWVHYMDPHAPYQPPARYILPRDRRFALDFDRSDSQRRGANHRLYEGECRFVDDLLRPVLPKLAADRRTLTVVTADHGEEFWEHGPHLYEHGKSVYDTLLRIPLVVGIPGGRPGRVDTPVSLVGLTPSLLTVAGRPVPNVMQGDPFLDGAGRVSTRGAPIFVGSSFFFMGNEIPPRKDAVVRWPRKFTVEHARLDGPGEYYDLAVDPDERYPLPGDAASEELRAELKAWQRRVQSDRIYADFDGLVPADLKALGYVK